MLLQIDENDNSIHTDDACAAFKAEGMPSDLVKLFRKEVKEDFFNYDYFLEIQATYIALKTKPELNKDKFLKNCKDKRLKIKNKNRVRKKFNLTKYSYSMQNNQGIINYLTKETFKKNNLLDKQEQKGVLKSWGRTYLMDLIKSLASKNTFKEIDSQLNNEEAQQS